jgi:uncharacterized protein (TIRG00374 family)
MRAPERRTERGSIGDRVERTIESRTDEGEIERAAASEPDSKGLRRTVFWLVVTGVSLYLVAPSILDVFGSWRQLERIDPLWFLLMLALMAASLCCLWWLQKLALPSAPISGVVDSQLAGNALSKIAPGGGAVGAALQYKMLVDRGVERGRAVTAITAVNLLTFAIVLALPVLALPALFAGGIDQELKRTGLGSLAVFAALAAVAAVLLNREDLLRKVGGLVQRVRNRLRRHSAPSRGLPDRLVRERDRLIGALGPNRWRALIASVGRWAFDFAILLAALAAVGSYPSPGLVLLAFCAAQVLSQIPVTPGGLGFVEAGLTATLALAGVNAGDAVLATFAYRLITYWLPLPLGLLGLALHRRHTPAEEPT